MTTALTSFFSKLLNPFWLTGPLFDKELRVSARRKRNYALRFVYVILLTVFVAIVWLSVVQSQVSTTFQKSRMALAGKNIIGTIVTFQFFATQLIAVIMLSTSISDEIYNRTLGLLMTTPINSFQIVMGKLFSKLLQLILLLAISLPLLAIVRIFGGVPWGYVLSSVCITLTAVIFTGSLSLYFSINNRRAYVVIIKTIVALGILFAFIPLMLQVLLTLPLRYAPAYRPISLLPYYRVLMAGFFHLNPFAAMYINTAMMMSPGGVGGLALFHWPLHCAFMLGLSALLIARCVSVVRKVALRQASGQLEFTSKRRKRPKRKKTEPQYAEPQDIPGTIRPVKGSPVLWKELRAPLIQGTEGRNSIIGLAFTMAVLLATYGVWAKIGYLDEDFAHVSYTLLFIFMAVIFHIVLSATSITSEKESRAWPILLATSMDDWHILLGKAAGVFRRCLTIWLLLAGHVLFFVLVRYIHPIALVHLSMIVAWLVVFLTCSGLYFSTYFKRTTSAVVASFALAIVLWVVVPSVSGLIAAVQRDENVLAACMYSNPAVQTIVVMNATGGKFNALTKLSSLEYRWLTPGPDQGVFSVTAVLLITMLIYISIGFVFAWRAKCRFRRNIF